MIAEALMAVFLSMFVHELCHWLEGKRQGIDGRIEVWYWSPSRRLPWLKVPSMRYVYSQAPRSATAINFAGGIGSAAAMYLLSAFAFSGGLAEGAELAAAMQASYGVYEGFAGGGMGGNKYMAAHYLAYGLGALVWWLAR
jgi:hypothetical protein